MKRTTAIVVFATVTCLCIPERGLAQATYRADFVATWSAATHPGAFPGGAHFSPLIGATHDVSDSLWTPGSTATPGIERMAETGNTSTLRNEIASLLGTENEILGSGTGAPGSTSVTFDVARDEPLVSLVTMIAPSPDWFVGVHGLNLRDSGGWRGQVASGLFAYDSGTDSGANFTSSNADTNPQQPIALVGTPFAGLPELATLTFTLVSAAGDIDNNLKFDCNDINLLVSAIAAGSSDSSFDLDGNGQVDIADRDVWLAEAGELPTADLDLDGSVDSADLGLLLNSFGGSDGETYCGGDIDANDSVTSADLGLLLNEFGTGGDPVAQISQVPEPTGLPILLPVAYLACLFRRRRRD